MFPKYPYLDLSDRNLDFLTRAIREMENEVRNFVSINALKYANPLQWDITKSYEKNTVVITADTGVAYISVKPVPAGINITRSQFWTKVFDLSAFLEGGLSNFARNFERNFTYTATMKTLKNEWVVWNSVLYYALTDINIGDMYASNVNIKRFTIEDAIEAINDSLANLNQTLSDEIVNREDADLQIRLDVADLVSSKVTILSDAINGVAGNLTSETTNRENADIQIRLDVADLVSSKVTILSDAINTETTNRENADTSLSNKIGNLNNLSTTDKSNVVSAINEVAQGLAGLYDTADIRNYGGKADGTTDNTSAFNACMADNNLVYMPNYNNGTYKLGAITLSDKQSVIGTEGTTIATTASNLFTITGCNVDVKNLIINTSNNVFYINSNAKRLEFIHIENVYSYGANRFIYDNTSANNIYTNLYVNRCAARQHKSYGIDLTKAFAFTIMEDVTIDSVGVNGTDPMFRISNAAGAQLIRCEAEGGYTDGSNTSHGGFVINNSQAIWFERCMADTLNGTGYNFSNSQYIYMNACAASLCGAHGIAILTTTCANFNINGCYIGGRSGMPSSPAGANGIYNFNDYIKVNNCEIVNMTGYGVADGVSAGAHNNYSNLTFANCQRSFVADAGGGIVMGCVSSIPSDNPTYGSYQHINNLVNGTFA